jgi:hypothetical protein
MAERQADSRDHNVSRLAVHIIEILRGATNNVSPISRGRRAEGVRELECAPPDSSIAYTARWHS